MTAVLSFEFLVVSHYFGLWFLTFSLFTCSSSPFPLLSYLFFHTDHADLADFQRLGMFSPIPLSPVPLLSNLFFHADHADLADFSTIGNVFSYPLVRCPLSLLKKDHLNLPLDSYIYIFKY
jgi:hypothetical protein